MGLAVAQALAKRGDWQIHIVDLNVNAGEQAEKELGKNAKFHKCNVAVYQEQANIFDSVHKSAGRLDFVFANAGIVERFSFYEKHEQSPPPEIDQLSIDIDLKAVVITSYLAQHYFRLSKPSYGKGTQSLVMTASCGGLYPSPFCPMYSAAKHGVVGLMRSLAKHYYLRDSIRVNCICPGTVRTNLLDVSNIPP
jgi:NAD(P)-dependent dehydrogenase (short-subunit alcohol dehydrogenase family)